MSKEQNWVDRLDDINDLIEDEIGRAMEKFPEWPDDPIHASAIVQEECGDLVQAVLESIYEKGKSSKSDVEKEAVQTACVAIRFLLSINKYKFEKSGQHDQF